MTYDVTFDRRSNFIHAVVTGRNTADSIIGYMNEIRDECEKQDCHRVLIEENLDGRRLDEMQIFDIISQGSADALGVFEALAYVDEQQDFEVVKFAETVAINRGIPIAVFSSVSDAENWLRHHVEGSSEQDIFTDSSDSGD